MYDEELEKIMLFHIIFNNYVCDLTEKDFVDSKNVIIIKAINKLKKEKQDINLINIQEKIQRNNSKILEYLVKLGDYGIGTEADTIYNKIIQLSQKRAIYNLLKENIITVTERTPEETYTDLLNKTNKIMQRNEKEETFVEQISKTGEEIEKSYKNRNDYSLYIGISDLDDKILGLHNGELTIIGARPRCGCHLEESPQLSPHGFLLMIRTHNSSHAHHHIGIIRNIVSSVRSYVQCAVWHDGIFNVRQRQL